MESPSESAAADSSARTYSQVVFTDIPHSYPPSTAVTCCYTLTAGFQHSPRDWVGIFKVGWSTTKDYHTFVWVEPSQGGQQSANRQSVFKDYYLPKDEIEFYQFCYVDSTGQVRGASTPFSFKSCVDQSMESSPDDDLLVITTQEQVEQSVREKTELQRELDLIREENETLKRVLHKEQQEAASLKGGNEQKEKEKAQLAEELDQLKEQNQNLQSTKQLQLQEIEHLKEELQVQKKKQMEMQSVAEEQKLNRSLSFDEAPSQNETHIQEKYNRALLKIKQLKEEREELMGKIDDLTEEIPKLHFKVREGERELLKTKDSIQLLQVDLQSSEKEKERLSAQLQRLTQNMEEVKRENQELGSRLSEQETLQSCPDDDLKLQTLAKQLQETQAKLAAEKEVSRNIARKADVLEREQQEVKEQLENINALLVQEQQKTGKLQLQLLELREGIAEREGIVEEKEHMIKLVNHEKEELAKENQSLKSNIEGLRSLYANLHEVQLADSPNMQPDGTSAAGNVSTSHPWREQETSEETENLYETIGGRAGAEEELLVCRHCQESFPGITRNELEQHEQSHRVCPFCTMICDTMEQSVFEDHVYGHEL